METTPICDNGGKGQLVHPHPENVKDGEQPPAVKGNSMKSMPLQVFRKT